MKRYCDIEILRYWGYYNIPNIPISQYLNISISQYPNIPISQYPNIILKQRIQYWIVIPLLVQNLQASPLPRPFLL
jgi:hypothetical protein